MTIQYQGRTLTVETTDDASAPYRLVGARGSALSLVPHSRGRGLFFVKTASGKLNGGFVGLLADGSLIWLPSSGKEAAAAQKIWRANRAA